MAPAKYLITSIAIYEDAAVQKQSQTNDSKSVNTMALQPSRSRCPIHFLPKHDQFVDSLNLCGNSLLILDFGFSGQL